MFIHKYIAMSLFAVLVVSGVALGTGSEDAQAMNKAELIDSIASQPVDRQLEGMERNIDEIQALLSRCEAAICEEILDSSDSRQKLVGSARDAASEGDLEAVEKGITKLTRIVERDIKRIEKVLEEKGTDKRERLIDGGLSEDDRLLLKRVLQKERKLDKQADRTLKLAKKKVVKFKPGAELSNKVK